MWARELPVHACLHSSLLPRGLSQLSRPSQTPAEAPELVGAGIGSDEVCYSDKVSHFDKVPTMTHCLGPPSRLALPACQMQAQRLTSLTK